MPNEPIIQQENENLPRSTTDALPLVYFIVLLAAYFTVYRAFPSQWQIVVLGLLVCTSSVVLRLVGKSSFSVGTIVLLTMFGSLALGTISMLMLVPIALIGVALTFWNFTQSIRRKEIGLDPWMALLGSASFAWIGAIHLFNLNYPYINLDNSIEYNWLQATSIPDDLFHISIINMIRDSGIPSTGLHSTPYLSYHYLAHSLVAGMVRVTGLPAIEIYHLTSSFIFFPIALVALSRFWNRLPGGAGVQAIAWLLLAPILFGVFHSSIVHWTKDFTMTLSGALIFCFLASNVRFPLLTTIIPLLFLMFLSKVSTGAIFICAFIAATLVAKQSPMYRVSALLLSISTFFLGYLLAINNQGAGAIEIQKEAFYSFWKSSNPGKGIWDFLYQYWLLSLFALPLLVVSGVRAYRRLGRDWPTIIRNSPLTVVCATVYLASIAACFITLPNGSNKYFILPAEWISGVLICYLIPQQFLGMNASISRGARRLTTLGFATVSLIFVAHGSSDLFSFESRRNSNIKDYLNFYRSEVSPNRSFATSEEFRPYFNALRYVSEHYGKQKFLVEIPRTEKGFWDFTIYPGAQYWMPFYIPAISGKPAWGAYNEETMLNTNVAWYGVGAYGYRTYFELDKRNDIHELKKYQGRLRIERIQGVVTLSELNLESSNQRVVHQFPASNN